MSDQCPLCGSTRFTQDAIDVSSGGRRRYTPGLRSCLDCQNRGASVLLAEVERLRDLLAELLTAYKEQAGPLHDPREPERYRRWAEELVAKVEAAIGEQAPAPPNEREAGA
jgi:hypothetical protein